MRYNIQEQEEREFTYSSDTEWDRDEALHAGAARPDRAWILTDRDVWHRNPFYAGPAVPHPEDAWDEEKIMNYTPMNAQVMSFVMYDSEVKDTIEDLIVTLVLDGHNDAASKVAWVYGMSAEEFKDLEFNVTLNIFSTRI